MDTHKENLLRKLISHFQHDNVPVGPSELAGDEIKTATPRPSPAPKLIRQIEELRRLPRAKQRFVSELLDTVLQQATAR